jgi:hypothetical protein
MARQDLYTDGETKDLVIDTLSGDFITRESDTAHIDAIVNTSVGQWKQSPLLGVGIFTFLNAPGGLQTAKRITQKQLESDGYDAEKITANSDGSLNIIAQLEANE